MSHNFFLFFLGLNYIVFKTPVGLFSIVNYGIEYIVHI